MRSFLRIAAAWAFVAAAALALPVNSAAQRFELHPYAGGFFPKRWADTVSLQPEGMYGVRAGVYVSESLEVEGHAGFMNQFRFEHSSVDARAAVWDLGFNYTVPDLKFRSLEPFFGFAAGVVTIHLHDNFDPPLIFLDPTFSNLDSALGPLILTGNDKFLGLSYGGGLKALRVWGPLGIRTDLRARSLPNFFNHAITRWKRLSA